MEGRISMQEQIPELDKRVEEEEDDDDDDIDGPPPGFQSITTKVEVDEEEDEGPPPGLHSIDPKPLPAPHSSDEDSQQDVEDDADGPPPGWEFFSMANALPKLPSISADANVENNVELNEGESESDSDDEGPPPGWEKVLHHKMPSSRTPPLQPSQAVSSGAESKGQTKDVNKRPTSVPSASSKQSVPAESVGKGDTKDVDKRPKFVPAASPKQAVPSASHPSTANAGSSSSEKAQLVCGTCWKLMVYPRGAKRIQCPGCQEVNFVLEANEVGQVKCGNCAVLLMYQFGAPAVICTSCSFITKIGANNRRPPLSVQMAQRRRRGFRGRAR